MARPAEAIEPKAYIRKAFEETTVTGTFTVHLIAHDPFAKMGKLSITDLAELEANSGFLRYHTGLLPADIMPPLDHSGTIGKTKELLLYNPGSERTPLTIEAAGDVGDDGLLLVNRTTGQRCRIVKLTKQATTQAGAVLSLDGEHGRTVLVHSGVATPAYAYHDEGYIALEGASPIDRDLVFRYVGGSRRATCDQSLHADVVGRYVHLHAGWRHITSLVNDHTIGVDFTFQHSGTETSAVVCMNEMVLTTASGLTLDTLRFSYVPRYA